MKTARKLLDWLIEKDIVWCAIWIGIAMWAKVSDILKTLFAWAMMVIVIMLLPITFVIAKTFHILTGYKHSNRKGWSQE